MAQNGGGGLLQIKCPELPELSGTYTPLSMLERGEPVWARGDARLYADSHGFWRLTSTADGLARGLGWYISRDPRSEADPAAQKGWLFFKDSWVGSQMSCRSARFRPAAGAASPVVAAAGRGKSDSGQREVGQPQLATPQRAPQGASSASVSPPRVPALQWRRTDRVTTVPAWDTPKAVPGRVSARSALSSGGAQGRQSGSSPEAASRPDGAIRASSCGLRRRRRAPSAPVRASDSRSGRRSSSTNVMVRRYSARSKSQPLPTPRDCFRESHAVSPAPQLPIVQMFSQRREAPEYPAPAPPHAVAASLRLGALDGMGLWAEHRRPDSRPRVGRAAQPGDLPQVTRRRHSPGSQGSPSRSERSRSRSRGPSPGAQLEGPLQAQEAEGLDRGLVDREALSDGGGGPSPHAVQLAPRAPSPIPEAHSAPNPVGVGSRTIQPPSQQSSAGYDSVSQTPPAAAGGRPAAAAGRMRAPPGTPARHTSPAQQMAAAREATPAADGRDRGTASPLSFVEVTGEEQSMTAARRASLRSHTHQSTICFEEVPPDDTATAGSRAQSPLSFTEVPADGACTPPLQRAAAGAPAEAEDLPSAPDAPPAAAPSPPVTQGGERQRPDRPQLAGLRFEGPSLRRQDESTSPTGQPDMLTPGRPEGQHHEALSRALSAGSKGSFMSPRRGSLSMNSPTELAELGAVSAMASPDASPRGTKTHSPPPTPDRTTPAPASPPPPAPDAADLPDTE
eukprot:TRINITY_DN9274_c0_g1_i1.p1 TRINITY_DN9274_c0_g1~~TRINITY_DN9274_c0_g1_i1.p1  ORF type:complete len:765 (+),score=171.24 TRINITY_DN9274_c0_g1_i1:92-2296(+)